MLGCKRKEGKALGPAEGPTSSLPGDLWDLTAGMQGRWSRKMQGMCVCVGGGEGGLQMLTWKRRTHTKGGGQKEMDSFNGAGRAGAPRGCFRLVVPG